jgi:hypothetical protein
MSGMAGLSGAGGSAGGGQAGMAGTGGGPAGCLLNWSSNATCDTCSGQTQSDLKSCSIVLDCYLANNCGPETCNDQTCGANKLQKGTAAYPVAKTVYDCLCD